MEYLQSRNDYVRDWLLLRNLYCNMWTATHSLPVETICHICKRVEGTLRCKQCFTSHLLCHSCCLTAHHLLPWHRLEQWNGNCFVPAELIDLGFVLYLGHNGVRCPNAPPSSVVQEQDDDTEAFEEDNGEEAFEEDNSQEAFEEEDDPEAFQEDLGLCPETRKITGNMLILVHNDGIFYHNVCFCHCQLALSHHAQLFQAGLFAASTLRPKTAFTFACLDALHLDLVECKTSASNFYNKLRRFTNNAFPQAIHVGALAMKIHWVYWFILVHTGSIS